jgi:DNA-binding NtrC family response regulator
MPATIRLARSVPHRVLPFKGGGLEPAEDVLLGLALEPEPDLTGALGRLRDALGVSGACFCEASTGDPLIVASAGDLKDLPVHRLRALLAHGPSAPGEAASFAEAPLPRGMVMAASAGQRFALVVWGGGSVPVAGAERLIQAILLFAYRLHTRAVPRTAERAARGEGPLVFPEGYVRGHSPAILELYAHMRALGQGDVPVLLLGETGVGKEQLARVLHASSRRRAGPFVAVNCAAIPAELLEAEMFGIGKGVATGVSERPGHFQLARGGTLFLDEIGAMPLALQAKLLRALQGREIQPVGGAPVSVDTRVVTATNTELATKMEQGQFRRDLYYRVAAFVVHVPRLRDRPEDIPALAQAFLSASAREIGKSIPGITAATMRALAAYAWPGNVRELEHEARRLAYLCPSGEPVDINLLSPQVCAAPDDAEAPSAAPTLQATVDHTERRAIRAALVRTGGRRSAAARLLGISRNGLAMKMGRLGLVG